MRINIIGFSSKGCALAKRISEELKEHDCSFFGKTIGNEHGGVHVDSVDEWVASSFRTCDALIFVGAAGIAVRHIAPYLRNKAKDPAVIVIDELGRNVIPILSGHIGGANTLSKTVGERIGANVIITTATDLNKVFSVDTFAVENDLRIGNLEIAKEISARMLEGLPVFIKSDVKIEDELPKGLTYADNGDMGIYITASDRERPFERTLVLTPKQMTLGIGCHRGTEMRMIEEHVIKVLKENGISIRSVKAGGSIDLKSDEKGLIEFFERYDIPMTFFTKDELEGVKGKFTESDYVRSITGVGNVCERSALALCSGGKIVVRKTAGNGVTVAVARDHHTVRFGDRK
jgi:cobalt-precorrin 5A hydrolase